MAKKRSTSRRGKISKHQAYGRYLNETFHATKGGRPRARKMQSELLLILPNKPYGSGKRQRKPWEI